MFTIQPYNDELLSSWLMRVARKNHTNLSTIILHIFRGNPIAHHSKKLHVLDIDLYKFDREQKDMVYKHTGVELDKHQLYTYEGFLDEKIDRYHKKWITETKTAAHRTQHFFSTRFCPECLKENPYIRKPWKIMLYNICSKHNCYLLSCCPSCNASLVYNHNDYIREMHICYQCSLDLRLSPSNTIEKHKYIQAQNKILNILGHGYYKLNDRYYYSIGLFVLLKRLVHTVMRVNKINLKYINQLQPVLLAKIISHILFLLEHFPHRVNRYYKKKRFTSKKDVLPWHQLSGLKDLPTWFVAGIEYNVHTKYTKEK